MESKTQVVIEGFCRFQVRITGIYSAALGNGKFWSEILIIRPGQCLGVGIAHIKPVKGRIFYLAHRKYEFIFINRSGIVHFLNLHISLILCIIGKKIKFYFFITGSAKYHKVQEIKFGHGISCIVILIEFIIIGKLLIRSVIPTALPSVAERGIRSIISRVSSNRFQYLFQQRRIGGIMESTEFII